MANLLSCTLVQLYLAFIYVLLLMNPVFQRCLVTLYSPCYLSIRGSKTSISFFSFFFVFFFPFFLFLLSPPPLESDGLNMSEQGSSWHLSLLGYTFLTSCNFHTFQVLQRYFLLCEWICWHSHVFWKKDSVEKLRWDFLGEISVLKPSCKVICGVTLLTGKWLGICETN